MLQVYSSLIIRIHLDVLMKIKYVVRFLLGDASASDFYMQMFQNTLSLPSS
jgi:hypothetical protein